MSDAFLLVAAGGTRIALPLAQLEGVTSASPVVPVPTGEPAVAGVATIRGETLPVVSLAALLGVAAPPADAFVLVDTGGVRICLAVDEAETLARGEQLPLPGGGTMPWARAVLRTGGGYVPLLDLEALAERLAATGRAS